MVMLCMIARLHLKGNKYSRCSNYDLLRQCKGIVNCICVLKRGNMLLDEHGNGNILDFGLYKIVYALEFVV